MCICSCKKVYERKFPLRATANGMAATTLLVWRPGYVVRRTPFWVSDLITSRGLNLYCGAFNWTRLFGLNLCCVQSSLP